MKPQTPISLLTLLLLAACGGGSSDNTAPADPKPAPSVPDNKPQTLPASASDVSLGDVLLPPRTAPRPDAATQAKLDAAFAATNELRTEKGLPPFTYNESLAAYATIRAQELSTQQGTSVEHKRPNGQNPLDPANFIGSGALAENIGADRSSSAASIVAAWRNSPHHYATITSKNFQNLGIGYYYAANSVWHNYWAQTFTGGNTRSIYSYITPIRRDEVAKAAHDAAQYTADGRLTLNAPRDSTNTSGIGSNPYTLALGREHRITLFPYQSAGWSYQTFGAISDNSGVPEAYLNVGKPFTPGDGATLQADYRGSAIGDLGQHDRVTAEVSAHLDYGSAHKTLSLKVDKAMRSGLSFTASSATRDARLDFEDTLNWNANTQRFESDTGNARLYGAGGEELGGQFSRAVGNEAYRGAYGAKKVQ